jgi:hypothetical protein
MRTPWLAALTLLTGLAPAAQAQDPTAPTATKRPLPPIDLEAAATPTQTATFALG